MITTAFAANSCHFGCQLLQALVSLLHNILLSGSLLPSFFLGGGRTSLFLRRAPKTLVTPPAAGGRVELIRTSGCPTAFR